jgi:signal transduction histidine kinase
VNFEARMTDFSTEPGADLGVSARQLAAAVEPVFIFDGKQPVLVWANAAALKFVGHASAPGAQLPHLDRSMPAMARLRALAEQDVPEHGVSAELLFWTPLGAQSLACICRRGTFAFAPEAMIVHAVAAEPIKAKPKSLNAEVEQALPTAKDSRERARGTTPKSRALKAKLVSKSVGKFAGKSKVQSRTGTAPKTRGKEKGSGDPRALRGLAVAPVSHRVADPIEAPPPPLVAAESNHDTVLREIARQIQAATQTQPPAGTALSGPLLGRSPMLFAGETDAPAAAPPPTAATPAEQKPVASNQAMQASAPPSLDTQSRHNVDFLSHIGHEIRTPLNSILGFAEIMREERFGAIGNARYKTYAADIHDSALHALSLINDFLDLSRIEAGVMQLDLAEVDVARVMAQTVASLQPIALKAEVFVIAPTGRPLPHLVCDARSLKQMLLNLLSNAIKHTDAGGAVWITAATSDYGGLVIRVQDTGVGMRAEDIALALAPYGQVGSAERRAGGTGLGLPLTKAMAQANGGRLVLERIAGGGLAALLAFPAESVVRS